MLLAVNVNKLKWYWCL